MSNLERRPEQAVNVQPKSGQRLTSARDLAGGGLNVSDVDWSGEIVELSDLDTAFPPTDWELANAVVDDGLVRRRGTAYYRRRVAWSARRDEVVVATCEQTVAPQPDGRFRPIGAYRTVSLDVHQVISPCGTRRGEVPVDGTEDSRWTDSRMSQASNSDDAHGREGKGFREAHETVAMLPTAVRRSIFARATPPAVFAARAIRRLNSGTVTVSALRLRDDEAIAVIGSLQGGATTWQVEQRTYCFEDAPRLTGDRRPAS